MNTKQTCMVGHGLVKVKETPWLGMELTDFLGPIYYRPPFGASFMLIIHGMSRRATTYAQVCVFFKRILLHMGPARVGPPLMICFGLLCHPPLPLPLSGYYFGPISLAAALPKECNGAVLSGLFPKCPCSPDYAGRPNWGLSWWKAFAYYALWTPLKRGGRPFERTTPS